jgi:hypothetical protein
MPHQVLVYGHDSLLLMTRELLLRGAGFDVCVCSTVDAAHAILAAHPFDLLVLCHSADPTERSSILATARARQKNLAILILVADYQNPPVSDNEVVFCTLEGPNAFLRVVCELTHDPTSSPFASTPHRGQKRCPDLQAQ